MWLDESGFGTEAQTGGEAMLSPLGVPWTHSATRSGTTDEAAAVAHRRVGDDRRLHPSATPADAAARPQVRVLPACVAALIAAGEVVERPASVVKELVENALDAGAHSVRVDVRGGGLGLIRVGDDGFGIRTAELWLACQRHATSKLGGPTGGALERVRTLGFRGEALPSIAAVAELTLVSATDDRGVGWRLTLRDDRVVADEPAPRPRGTTVSVRHLFHNVPARLAAAGRAQTEIAEIGQTARRLALAAPWVAFTLMAEDRLVVRTSGSGDLATALVEVYGSAITGAVLPLGAVEVEGARIAGVIAGAELTRPGRGQVNVIVNGRWAQPRGLLARVEACYRPVLPRGRHPVLAMTIDTEPDRVDVNVHPSKLEVRLLAERAIAAAAGELVRNALGRRPLPLHLALATGLDALPPAAALAEDGAAYDVEGEIVTPGLPPLRLLGQVRNRLLLLEGEAGLYLIDQHRAHERVLYERLAGEHGGDAAEAVAMPEPLLIELRPAQLARLGPRLGDLAALGFDCEPFGRWAVLVRTMPLLPGIDVAGRGASDTGVPALDETDDLVPALLELVDEEAGEGEGWRERLLVRFACRAAVRRGRPLERPAMRALVERLGNTRAPAVCPHGSPLLMHVSGALLENQFDWD